MNYFYKKPIINCHTHIFKGDHVPPYLAKQFIPFPVDRLIHTHVFLALWQLLRKIKDWFYRNDFIFMLWHTIPRKFALFVRRNPFFKIIWMIVKTWSILNALIILLYWLSSYAELAKEYLDTVIDYTDSFSFLIIDFEENTLLSIALFSIVFLFYKSGRNLILFLLKSILKFFKLLPGRNTLGILKRYVLLAHFTRYKSQGGIFSKLRMQYPSNSKFILLPMDMEFMEAGRPKESYYKQLNDLAELKDRYPEKCLPFFFVDPRRIKEETEFFNYKANNGKVELQDCLVKEYIEEKKFSGFKIYPALGYYPFDELLLPLWKYAADHQIPIMTHCIAGTIFYRGTKKKEWDNHPVFKTSEHGKGINLLEVENIDFSINFTHPMNYLCLLNEPLLRTIVTKSSDSTKELFGFINSSTKLKYDLAHLKICLAHYGGEEQWNKYFERDRHNYSQHLIKHRDRGLDFSLNSEGKIPWGRYKDIWRSVDWYSIISSLMIQYDNVYSDISYVLSKPSTYHLLKESVSMVNPKMRKRILFGTDFYVVRNHNSEKELLAKMKSLLSENEFDLIARENPIEYLESK